MNKANFNDMFKSILIILLFIIIIGLIWITTNPKLIKDMICNVEGFTSNNTINQCNRCYITPFNVSADNNRIENILNRNINQHNFYFIDNDISYLFTTWKHDRNFNENCTTVEERDRNRPCCLTDDSINQSNFYKSNYIEATQINTLPDGTQETIIQKIYGILFKVDISHQIIPENTINFTFKYNPIKNLVNNPKNFRINENFSFKYFTSINNDSLDISAEKVFENIDTDNSDLENPNLETLLYNPDRLAINLTTSRNNITKRITCNGIREDIPAGDTDMVEDCDISEISRDKARLNRFCWQQGNNITDKCQLTNIRDDCRIFLPKDGVDITGNDGDSGDSNVIDTDLTSGTLTNPQTISVLQEAADRLVQKFSDRISNINVFNPGFSGIEFPNIGNPTYLNIGRCNANSPYVFNSSCSDNDNNNGQTTAGGFLYKFKCRPSLTGQFEVCGPLGYSARPDFS